MSNKLLRMVLLPLAAFIGLFTLAAESQIRFATTGSMTTPRGWATATLLADGSVLLAGGSSTSAEVYDPMAGTFSLTGSMQASRAFHTATLLASGKVLLAGGSGDSSAELYDPATATFTTTGPMAEIRYGHTATLLTDGKVLIAGGSTGDFDLSPQLDSAEIYDPASGTFAPTGSMTSARTFGAAAPLANGTVLMTGGYVGAVDNEGFPFLWQINLAEIYDPATGEFTGTGAMVQHRASHCAIALLDGTVLLVGGAGPTATAERYDPAAGGFVATGEMTVGREAPSATLLADGMVLMAGGLTSDQDPTLAELYDPATGTFSPAGTTSMGRYGHTAILLENGNVLIAGGWTANGFSDSAELYEFSNTQKVLYVSSATGNGSGTVTSFPAGINCGTACAYAYDPGSKVTLTAVPAEDSQFLGWSGDCSGTGPCVLSMDRGRKASAQFQSSFVLTVRVGGEGAGRVTSDPPGIDCQYVIDANTCSAAYPVGSMVALTAAAAHNSSFLGWFGTCSGTGACNIKMDTDVSVHAGFQFAPTFTVQVLAAGSGDGSVTSNVGDLELGSGYTLVAGDRLTLTAIPDAHSSFAGWSGACTGMGVCNISGVADASYIATASFTALPAYALSIALSGTGSGSVSSAPAGLTCGNTCSAPFEEGTHVGLVATPEPGSTFAGWGGACTGLADCVVSVTAVANVTATFNLIPQFALTIVRGGSGSGAVTSSPTGLSCGNTCSAPFAEGTLVTLTATPAPGSTFAGWGGVCTGTEGCAVNVTGALAVSATFSVAGFQLGSTAPLQQTVAAGQAATFPINLGADAGFAGTISFFCTSGLPAGAICVFDPPTVTAGNGTSGNTMLTISTTPRTSSGARWPRQLVFAIMLAPILIVAAPLRIRRRWLLAFGVLVLLIGSIAGCGGGATTRAPVPSTTVSGTPSGTYTIVVTASSGSITRTQNVALVVN